MVYHVIIVVIPPSAILQLFGAASSSPLFILEFAVYLADPKLMFVASGDDIFGCTPFIIHPLYIVSRLVDENVAGVLPVIKLVKLVTPKTFHEPIFWLKLVTL
jgi:hypothetical protein